MKMKQKETLIPVEISARHIHLSQEDLEVLFGKGYKLKPIKNLSQAGEFAAEETVDVEVNEITIKGIRVIGPTRIKTQAEVTLSDAYRFKADIPVRLSGFTEKTPGFRAIGPAGVAVKKEGLIVAKRHLHISLQEAEKLALKNGDEASVFCGSDSEREIIFRKVEVRAKDGFKLTMHIDVDEANACGLKTCGIGKLRLKIQTSNKIPNSES